MKGRGPVPGRSGRPRFRRPARQPTQSCRCGRPVSRTDPGLTPPSECGPHAPVAMDRRTRVVSPPQSLVAGGIAIGSEGAGGVQVGRAGIVGVHLETQVIVVVGSGPAIRYHRNAGMSPTPPVSYLPNRFAAPGPGGRRRRRSTGISRHPRSARSSLLPPRAQAHQSVLPARATGADLTDLLPGEWAKAHGQTDHRPGFTPCRPQRSL